MSIQICPHQWRVNSNSSWREHSKFWGWLCTKGSFDHLGLSPREAPTSSKLPWCLASVFEHEFGFMGYTSHHSEDPYLMTTNDQVEHTLKLVREIQGSRRVVFQLSKWFLHWMTFAAIITRLTQRHVTFLVIIRASICGQIAFKRKGMMRTWRLSKQIGLVT